MIYEAPVKEVTDEDFPKVRLVSPQGELVAPMGTVHAVAVNDQVYLLKLPSGIVVGLAQGALPDDVQTQIRCQRSLRG